MWIIDAALRPVITVDLTHRTDAERGVPWCLAPAGVRSEERQISNSRLEYNDSFYYSNRMEEWHTEGQLSLASNKENI